MNLSEVQNLINEAVAENPELFLVDWSISPSNKIEVLVDGDNGLPIDEVVRISRHIEHNLDRESEDFALTVSSPGVTRPLETPRQYKKNLGRRLELKTKENQYKGVIIEVDETSVTLEWKAREPKPIGKGKHTVTKTEKIMFENIDKATIQIDI